MLWVKILFDSDGEWFACLAQSIYAWCHCFFGVVLPGRLFERAAGRGFDQLMLRRCSRPARDFQRQPETAKRNQSCPKHPRAVQSSPKQAKHEGEDDGHEEPPRVDGGQHHPIDHGVDEPREDTRERRRGARARLLLERAPTLGHLGLHLLLINLVILHLVILNLFRDLD